MARITVLIEHPIQFSVNLFWKEHVRFLFSGRGDALPHRRAASVWWLLSFALFLSNTRVPGWHFHQPRTKERGRSAAHSGGKGLCLFVCLFKWINTSFIRSSPINARCKISNKPPSLSLSNVNLHFFFLILNIHIQDTWAPHHSQKQDNEMFPKEPTKLTLNYDKWSQITKKTTTSRPFLKVQTAKQTGHTKLNSRKPFTDNMLCHYINPAITPTSWATLLNQ